MIFGKLIGAVLGWVVGGPFLAILGLLVGHLFDQGYRQVRLAASPEQLQRIQTVFFNSVFTLLGYLAKADGRVSEEEIQQTEHFMAQMGLTTEHRREAIRLFSLGKATDFQPDATLAEFRSVCGPHPNLVQLLLVYLINVAMADGQLDAAEERVLHEIATSIGIARESLEQLLRMVRAQDSFRREEAQTTSENSVALAYQALGVSADASDKEVKRAYRKLMSEYHPDKLIGQGVPDDMIQAATERSQEIQRAYDLIKKMRG